MSSPKFSREKPTETYVPEPWKELLEPFANLHWQMDQLLRPMSDETLAELLSACAQPTATNCWYATHDAARWIKPEIEAEQRRRALEKKRRTGSAAGDAT